MFWILTILLCVASAEKCNLSSEVGKTVRPQLSLDRGAKFLENLYKETAKECHRGCCNSTRCDTSLYTGDPKDKNKKLRGYNCFYFHCDEKCLIRNYTEEYSVGIVTRAPDHGELPDFAAMFSSSGPKEHRPSDSEKESENKNSNSTVTTAAVKPEVTAKNQTATDTVKPDAPAKNQTATDTVKPDAPAKNQTSTDTVKPDAPAKNQTATDTVKPDAPAKNQTNAIEATPASSASNIDQITVKDHADKPDTSKANATKDKTNSGADPQQTSNATDTGPEGQGKVPLTPTTPEVHKVTLPKNEVPAVKAHTEASKTDHPNSTESEGDKKVKEEGKVKVVAVGPEEVNMTNSSDITLEVDVHGETRGGGYTKKDVVFWVAVVGGSSLIVFGLVTIVRVYRNKRRRLYSSLTDDYLINGMYSI